MVGGSIFSGSSIVLNLGKHSPMVLGRKPVAEPDVVGPAAVCAF